MLMDMYIIHNSPQVIRNYIPASIIVNIHSEKLPNPEVVGVARLKLESPICLFLLEFI